MTAKQGKPRKGVNRRFGLQITAPSPLIGQDRIAQMGEYITYHTIHKGRKGGDQFNKTVPIPPIYLLGVVF